MKTSAVITFPLLIFFLLVALTASSVGGKNEAVIDSEWKPVKANTPYLVLGFMSRDSEYLSRETFARNATSCRERPVLNYLHILPDRAEPIMFVLPSSSSPDDVVRVSTELNIKFTNPSRCNESGFWRVSGFDDKTLFETVLQDGSESRSDSTFTIRRTNPYTRYKFYFGSSSSADLGDNSTEIVGDEIHGKNLVLKTRRAARRRRIEIEVHFVKPRGQ
ncbi:unnamed protein product [Microthlaspi erraticum]|uniref:Uncharacterized protein n=1 Tax=Microthlaspi erraticum TaxID=1685480 RepID=A0A6D2LE03_9BRAS|nr:unnamed protein product [Microthlaspi erraticum]